MKLKITGVKIGDVVGVRMSGAGFVTTNANERGVLLEMQYGRVFLAERVIALIEEILRSEDLGVRVDEFEEESCERGRVVSTRSTGPAGRGSKKKGLPKKPAGDVSPAAGHRSMRAGTSRPKTT